MAHIGNPVMWMLDTGFKRDNTLDLVRDLQPRTRAFGYHLTLGGGVLNKGYSQKDLDLFFLPLDGSDPREDTEQPDPASLLCYLQNTVFENQGVPLFGDYPLRPDSVYAYKQKFLNVYGHKRVDVFIMKGSTSDYTSE